MITPCRSCSRPMSEHGPFAECPPPQPLCRDCLGSGIRVLKRRGPQRCHTCNGTGIPRPSEAVIAETRSHIRTPTFVNCGYCHGAGYITQWMDRRAVGNPVPASSSAPCTACDGKGQVIVREP